MLSRRTLTYRFASTLVQEVIYNMLPQQQRRELHRKAAIEIRSLIRGLSHGTHNLRRISALPRGERIAAIRKQREANIALAAASKFSWYKVSPIAPRMTRSRAPHVSCRNAA